jgi:hypothetical protein
MISAGPLFAWGESNPRALAMGGAYTAMANGYEAPVYNPANLGLSQNDHKFTINFFSAGVNVRNNSWSLKDYNDMMADTLTEDGKEDILAKIPEKGLGIDALAEATALSISYKRYALNFHVIGAGKGNVDKDPFEVILYGNAIKSGFTFEDISGLSWAVADFSLSYGHPLNVESPWPFLNFSELSVGGTFHYLYGITYFEVLEAQGVFETTDNSLYSEGTLIFQTAMGGSGFALDIGGAMVLKDCFMLEDDLVVSLSLQNLLSAISWSNEPESLVVEFTMDSLNYENLTDEVKKDSVIRSSDSTYEISSFSSDLPKVLKLGAATTYKNIKWAFDWEQGITSGACQSTTPRLSFGMEYLLLRWLPLRAGTSVGGGRGANFSIGFGLHFDPYRFDLAVANNSSILPGRSKGLIFALAMGFWF